MLAWAAVSILAVASGAALAAAPLLASPTGAAYTAAGAKIQPAEKTAAAFFGRSVALSADGTIAIVGAPHEKVEAGAAYVFERTGSTWTQKAKLEAGGGSSFFGRSVALSADGSIAVVGDPGNGEKVGAAWIFVRSGATWGAPQKLVGAGESGAGQFGRSVALSADGASVLVGGFDDAEGTGAVWAFGRSGSTWSAVGAKITGTGETGAGWFGRSVAISGDGSTAVVGASHDDHEAGAVFVLVHGAGGWTQAGSKLTGTGESGAAELGSSVALSGDGATALAGGPLDEGKLGAAWVFAHGASGWAQQGSKLTGGGESGAGQLGSSAALSGDGATALVAGVRDGEGVGATWVYERTGTTWAQAGSKLTGAGEVGKGEFGFGLALSADASTALAGGIADESHAGAAWPYTRVPPEEAPPTTTTHTETTASTTTTTSQPPPGHGVEAATFSAAPVLGVSGNVAPVSGTVRIKVPGHGFELLSGLRQIPFGSVVDATEGHVQVTTALPQGGQETGEFFDGQFVLTQGHTGVVTIQLTGGTRAGCGSASGGHHKHKGRKAARAAASRGRSRGVRKLWSNAHGTFTTKGSYAAGAVQGTEWLTEDRCNGTYIRVTRDKVKVTDLVHHRTFVVRAGHSIFVKAH